MPGLQYFLPGVMAAQFAPGRVLSRSILESRRLADVFADVLTMDDCACSEITTAGPGGKPGVVISALPAAHRAPPRRFGYHPTDKHVEWTQPHEDLWLAVDRMALPGPTDLARRVIIPGYEVQLADGNLWTVPTIRRWGGGTQLPRTFGWDAAGNFVETRKAGYGEHWERSAKVADFCFSGGHLPVSWLIETAVLALSINYRFGRQEQSVLGLVDSTNWTEILYATVDVAGARAYFADRQKKTKTDTAGPPPESPSSVAGSPDETPTIDPAAATCSSPPAATDVP